MSGTYRKSKCSLFPSCRGLTRLISATKRPDLHFWNSLHFSVHPNGIANEGIRPRSHRGAHVSALIGSYAQRLDRSHWMADTWAVGRTPWPGKLSDAEGTG